MYLHLEVKHHTYIPWVKYVVSREIKIYPSLYENERKKNPTC